jgi:uncharacterized protein (DUF433 family)
VDRTWPAKKTTTPRTVAPNVKSFLGDLLTTGRDYLGIPLADITTQLRAGKSIGEIADATPGKSRSDLIAALTLAANAKIDQAATDKQLTAEQVTALKNKVAAEITAFVDRKATVKGVNSAGTVKKP